MRPNKSNLKQKQNSKKRKVTMMHSLNQPETLSFELPSAIAQSILNALQTGDRIRDIKL